MIRPYTPEDLPQLLEVFRLNIPKYFDKREEGEYIKYLEEYGDTYFTIVDNDEVIGGVGCYYHPADRSGRVSWIFLSPDDFGKGHGRQAVEFCHSRFRSDERIEKLVVMTSQLTYRFFEKFGYRTSRTEKDHWGQGLDLYEMEMAKDG